MAQPHTLLIDSGDLPSLVAALLETHPEWLVLWHVLPPAGKTDRPPRILEAVHLHRDILKPERLIIARGQETAIPGANSKLPEGLEWSTLLLQALIAAAQLKCSRIVWPVQLGLDIDRIGAAAETAQAISDLGIIEGSGGVSGGISGGGMDIVIDLPLMDRTEAEVVDLAEDMGCPSRAFWPCQKDGPEPCTECPECQKWMSGYETARYPWPWTVQGAI